MVAEGRPVRPVGTDLKERRQEEGQHELGIKHERRQPWDERQPHAAEHEGDGNRKVQSLRENREGHTGSEKDQEKLKDVHGVCARQGWPKPPFIL